MEPFFLILVVLVILVIVLPIAAYSMASQARTDARRAMEENQRLQVWAGRLDDRIHQLEGELRGSRGQQEEGESQSESMPPSATAKVEADGPRQVPAEISEAAVKIPTQPVAAVPVAKLAAAKPTDGRQPAQLPPEPSSSPSPLFAKLQARMDGVNWEHFMGAKLFAWIGGLALFLGIAFFLKYAFDRNLIPPSMRAALGFAAGFGLLLGGFKMDRKKYTITSHTLCSTGILALYATTFACRSVYQFEFFGLVPTFLLMALITVAAFLLALRMDAVSVAVLGLAGGFLTPVLLPEGFDHPVALFGYIALLVIGLAGLALHKRWSFLIALGAAGTVFTQWSWYMGSFGLPEAGLGLGIFLFFAILFVGFAYAEKQRELSGDWFPYAAAALAGSAFAFAFACLGVRVLSDEPLIFLAAVFVASLCFVALSLIHPDRPDFHTPSGIIGFALLAIWLSGPSGNDAGLLAWMLGAILGFALIHSAFPLVAERVGFVDARHRWQHAFPLLALVLVLFPVANIEGISLATWPVVFMVTGLAVAASIVARTPWVIAAALLLTMLVLAVWIASAPPVADSISELVLVIGLFAVAISAVTFALRNRFAAGGAEGGLGGQADWEKPFNALTPHLPAVSAVLPFALLVMVVGRIPVTNPSSIFGLAIVLVGLLLGLAYLVSVHALPLVGLGCVVALQQVWQTIHLAGAVEAGAAMAPLLWHLVFFILFAAFPFVTWRRSRESVLPWIASALSGPLHFFLVHRLVAAAYPNDFMGVIPALFAIPSLAALVVLIKRLPEEVEARNTQLAWFGGVALFFITLIFPIQFSCEWITIGWALEGVALLWLFHRIPHPGLRLAGLALLAVTFARLAVNPAVFSYHPRGDMPIINWYLYTYGIGVACMFAGAWLLRPPRERVYDHNVPPILCGLGAVLAFFLVNIEIADFFAPAGMGTLTFDFSGNLGRDMCYTIAWSLFALALVSIGLVRRIAVARYAGLGLLAVALLKLFFHDLASLEALYRIGALLGTAVIAIFASFLYQKLLSSASPTDEDPPATAP
jgi:uncharacterized membrane protein